MRKETPVIGQEMPDHSIYAGLTADGKQQIFAMPEDIDVAKTFNDASVAIKKLNADRALGHNDWQIPTLDNLHVLQKNQNKGSLKDTFKTPSSNCPGWYWSATPLPGPLSFYSGHVVGVRFSHGDDLWDLEVTSRLRCRAVRLVAVPGL